MEQIISKDEIKKFSALNGETRGDLVKSYLDFILKEKGERGLRQVEKVMAETGYRIKHSDIKAMSFYPIGVIGVILLSAQRIFNFTKEKFIEMGKFEAKISLILKLFTKYLFATNIIKGLDEKIWRKYFTIGDFSSVERNDEKGYLIYRLENFYLHPLHCYVLLGYLCGLIQMVTGEKKMISEEVKCMHRGDDCHEFLIKRAD